MEKEFLGSMELEDYVVQVINRKDYNDFLKVKLVDFLNKYLFRGLYVELCLNANSDGLIIQALTDEDIVIDTMEVI